MNRKTSASIKRHHVNVYLNDDDKAIFDTVMSHHQDVPVDQMLIYAFKRIYGNANFPQDYNAMLIAELSEHKTELENDVKSLRKTVIDKQAEIDEIDEKLKELMEGQE